MAENMVERVARAIYPHVMAAECDHRIPGCDCRAAEKQHYLDKARAAIAAMRLPTEEMKIEGAKQLRLCWESSREAAASWTFQTMIDLRPDLASYTRVSYARELHGQMDGASSNPHRLKGNRIRGREKAWG